MPTGSSDAPATFRAGDIVHQRRSEDVDRIASQFIYARATLWITTSPVYQVALASAIRSMLYSLLHIVRSEIELVVERVAHPNRCLIGLPRDTRFHSAGGIAFDPRLADGSE